MKALIKVNHKQLKVILALRVINSHLVFKALKLGKFQLFNNFFFNLADFWDLNNFLSFKFSNIDKF